MSGEAPVTTTKSFVNNNKEGLRFSFFYVVSRFFILFMPASLLDQDKIYDLQSFPNLQAYPALNPLLPYPLLFSIQLSTLLFIFGATMVGYRLGIIVYELGSILVLYKFVVNFQMREFQKPIAEASRVAFSSIYLFAFFPAIIFHFIGNPEHIAMFFMISGLYMYYKERVFLASFLLSLGFFTEFFPIFCLFPIIINSLVKKDVKKLVKLIIPLLILFIPLNLPYFLANPAQFIADYSAQLFHLSTAVSLWDSFSSVLPVWSIFSIEFGPIELILIITISIFCIFAARFFSRQKIVSHKQEFLFILIFAMILPAVFLHLIPLYFFFASPIFCLFMQTRTPGYSQRRLYTKIIAILIPTAIVNLILWPDVYLATPPRGGSSITTGSDVFYGIAICFFLGLAVLWVVQAKRWNFGYIRESTPKIMELIMYGFLVFIVQFGFMFLLAGNSFAFIVFVTLLVVGIVISLWIAIKIYNVIAKNSMFSIDNS